MGSDPNNANSIIGALVAARENARGARETISSEMWECLNVTWHSLSSRRLPAQRPRPAPLLRFVAAWGARGGVAFPELRAGAGGRVRRAGRVGDEPRRRLAVPRAGTRPRAGRHDVA